MISIIYVVPHPRIFVISAVNAINLLSLVPCSLFPVPPRSRTLTFYWSNSYCGHRASQRLTNAFLVNAQCFLTCLSELGHIILPLIIIPSEQQAIVCRGLLRFLRPPTFPPPHGLERQSSTNLCEISTLPPIDLIVSFPIPIYF